MNRQIRDKNQQFRNSIRKRQLQAYFKQKREQLINNQISYSVQDVNDQIIYHMKNGNSKQIYQILYMGETQKKLKILTSSVCIDLFNYLVNNITNFECILVLKVFILVNYRVIFLNKNLQEANIRFIDILYQKIKEKVEQLSFHEDESAKKGPMKYIGAYLDCLRTLIQFKDMKDENFQFNFAYQPELMEKLWQYLKYIYMNPFYLLILSLSELDLQIISRPKVQEIIIANPSVIQKIILQIDSNNGKVYTISLPSLTVANSIVKNMLERKDFIIGILPSYLKQLKFAYQKQFTDRTLQGNYFSQMLENILFVFDYLSSDILAVNLGKILSQTNVWTLLFLCVRHIGKNSIREQIYQILKLALKNICINKAPLQSYLTQTLLSFLVEGAQSQSMIVIIASLQSIRYILYNSSEVEENVFQQFELLELDNILQNLVYSRNEDVRTIASQLIKVLIHIKQNGDSQMSIEI